jgi:hypothetical protein
MKWMLEQGKTKDVGEQKLQDLVRAKSQAFLIVQGLLEQVDLE